jgi:iron complex transport system permease protein
VSAALLLPAGLVIFAMLGLALFFGGELSILELGENMAQGLGLHVRAFRLLFLAIAAALAGAAVSFAGLLGFIGLTVPHITRLLLRDSGKRMSLGVSAMIGATFLLLCDTVARTAFSPHELPVGVLVAYFGVPFFLWLLFKGRRRHHD